MTIRIIPLTLALLFLASRPLGADQKGELVDRVLAIVEDKAVLESEIELEYRNRLVQMQRTALTDAEEEKLRRELLDALISELLLSVHAEKVGISVGDEEVYAEVERRIEEGKRTLGGEEPFEEQLAREGLTVDQLRSLWRDKLKMRMLSDRLVFNEVMKDVRVTEAEVRSYYDKRISDLPLRPETASLAQILILPSASDPIVEGARARIADIEKKLLAGDDFEELAREYSEGPSAKNGGSIGYVRLEDLNAPQFEAAVRELTVGEISGPVLTEFGYHLIKLEDVSEDEVLIRHILIMVEGGEEDWSLTAQLADSIRQQLFAGADFAEMAERYSADYKTKDRGGIVGEKALDNLPDHFREAIKDVDIGGIAPVIKEERGYRIVKVLGRAPARRYTFEEAREELKALLERERLQEKVSDYVEGLKRIYYVELKGEQ
jgi:peptidyl-prolyl cis-trans isomerase SurA